ncbi:rRNA N-glycosidase [Striga asiatica]|uniref:rRNA N-glycosylase n=1 Tax=Striga asiatica TaxID=4170 RepID=A0A5A7RFF5_STRAF|nr:rRNA N-glycosidase [Striga asiatica]
MLLPWTYVEILDNIYLIGFEFEADNDEEQLRLRFHGDEGLFPGGTDLPYNGQYPQLDKSDLRSRMIMGREGLRNAFRLLGMARTLQDHKYYRKCNLVCDLPYFEAPRFVKLESFIAKNYETEAGITLTKRHVGLANCWVKYSRDIVLNTEGKGEAMLICEKLF